MTLGYDFRNTPPSQASGMYDPSNPYANVQTTKGSARSMSYSNALQSPGGVGVPPVGVSSPNALRNSHDPSSDASFRESGYASSQSHPRSSKEGMSMYPPVISEYDEEDVGGPPPVPQSMSMNSVSGGHGGYSSAGPAVGKLPSAIPEDEEDTS